MIRHCECCGMLAISDSLCLNCITLKNNQSKYYGVELARPIHECLVKNCNATASKTGLCMKHNKLIHISNNHDTTRQSVNTVTHGMLDKLLNRYDTDNYTDNKRDTFDIPRVEEIIGEDCEENPKLPYYLLDNKAFRKPEKGYCTYKYPCFNEIYKGGLCKVHYEMKHGIPKSEKDISDDKEEKEFMRNSIPVMHKETGITRRKCATKGCNKQALLTKYCASCSAKR